MTAAATTTVAGIATTAADTTTSGRSHPGAEAARGAASLVLGVTAFMVVGLALPLTAAARDGGRHDRCQAAAGTSDDGGSGDDCPAPTAAAAQPVAPPASTPLPAPRASATSRPSAVPAVRPAARALAPADGTDLRASLFGAGAVAGLIALVVSGFRVRRRLRQGWDEAT